MPDRTAAAKGAKGESAEAHAHGGRDRVDALGDRRTLCVAGVRGGTIEEGVPARAAAR